MEARERLRGKVSREEAAALLVRDVMLSRPTTLPVETTVGELRRRFERPALHTALLTDGDTFAGALERDDLDPAADPDEPAINFARRPPETIGPDRPVTEALARLDATGDGRRLVVTANDGNTLCGLLCLNASLTHFCVGSHGPQSTSL